MAPGRRQGRGCWTCRLRRKRCNSVRPVCGSCQDLDITCYSGDARPSWMDGDAKQKLMSETIKSMIKQNALLRRERRFLADENQNIILATARGRTSHVDGVSASAPREHVTPASSVPSTISTDSGRLSILRSSIGQSEESPSSFTSTSSTSGRDAISVAASPGAAWPAGMAVPIQLQLGSVMIYLDYVFPFLFPFYQPSLLETGRQWVLGLLCQNEVSFHIAASLSAYFFSLVPQSNEQDMHDDCKALVWDGLVEQMDSAVKSIQSTVSTMSRREAQSPLLDRVRIMEEVIQLLVVEITVQRNVDWTIHLTPALILFDEMFKSHGIADLKSSLTVLLDGLPSTLPIAAQHNKPLPYTADQSALVFFVSLVLFIDTIASTSLGILPALQSYHQSLLSSHSSELPQVRLEDVIGCQNWALVAVGDIAALCAWKRAAKARGTFSVVDLVNLAAPISQAIEEGLNDLDIGTNGVQPRKTSASRLEAYYSRHDKSISYTTIANVTRIWAHAAKIYLAITLSGWQANSTSSQASVAKILNLLQTIESLPQLRSLSWPICVAGCMASPSQEHDFRRVVGNLGPMVEFGTVINALHIMEAVWSSRGDVDKDTWDIASALRINGSPALLI